MCGLAGIVHFDDRPIDRDRLTAMLQHLRHRGPDQQGISELGRCGMVHARLSIIDPDHGRQPMHLPAPTGQPALSLVFNGEIYNHRELRRQLQSLGHRFVTDHCDTEVLLHGYRQWGLELPIRLEGMFAVAIWDSDARQLVLMRDRTGKKPLYVQTLPDGLRFASLIGTLLTAGEGPPTINRQALRTFLHLGYTGHASLIDGIAELPPGCVMVVSPDGQQQVQSYWQWPEPAADRLTLKPGELVQTVHQAVQAAVDRRLEADVPLGCFLSGGIDSSIVAAMAQQSLSRHGQQADRLRTFSVAMPGADYDESPHARAVAQHIGSQHIELTASPDGDLFSDLSHLLGIMGEPTADSSLLPTWWLSRAAGQHVKAALSGDGGDELFAGYDRYRALRLLAKHRGWLRYLPGDFLKAGEQRGWPARLRRLVQAARAPDPAGQYQRMISLFNNDQLTQLGLPGSDADLPPIADWPSVTDPAKAAMLWDLTHYLPQDLLRKVDRASMAVALEVRCPLLDTAVCELAAGLPCSALMMTRSSGGFRGQPKAILRQIAASMLPPSIVRRPKRGFAIPIGQWFRRELRSPLAERLQSDSLQRLGLNADLPGRLFQEHLTGRADHTHRLFALLSLVLWEQQVIRRPTGAIT